MITQNIDGLHQASGIPTRQGHRAARQHDLCRIASIAAQRYEIADVCGSAFERDGDRAALRRCGGFVKTATISFGQAMPVRRRCAAPRARPWRADLFIVLGSSLVVYPAAGFPELAKRNGASLVIVNREATPLDHMADLVIHHGIGDTLGGVVGVN